MVALVSASVAATGCSILGPGTDAMKELRENQRLWEQQERTDYSYVLRRSCFCGTEAMGPVRITVKDGVRTSAIYIESGEPVAGTYAQHFPTIDGLFEQLADVIGRADEFVAEYHPNSGYPIEVGIDFITNAVDDELGLTVTSLTPADTAPDG